MRRRGLIASPGSKPVRLRLFGLVLALLILLRIAVGYVAVPIEILDLTNSVVTILFMVLPILALFLGAGHEWDIKFAIAVVIVGVMFHVGGTELVKNAQGPVAKGILRAAAQGGLVTWCMGAGAALATLLKDRNMLLPIAAFLALFDMWLVFAPEGFVQKAISGGHAPISLEAAAYAIPKMVANNAPEAAPKGFASDLAFVGPADLLFLGMFFVALYRFRMRPKETFRAIAPVLLIYLAIVLKFPDVWLGPIRLSALPALLPIGITVLWVNRKEFKLLPDEKMITIGLLAMGIPFVIWRIIVSQPAPDPAPQYWSPPFEKSVEDLARPYQF